MKNEVDGRREIASRNTAWANIIARKLTRWGITPNQISMMSVFFALAGCLLLTGPDIFPDFNNKINLLNAVAYAVFTASIKTQSLARAISNNSSH